MNRAIVILGAATLAFGSASAYLYNDLRETRAETAALQVRVAELQKTVTAPTPVAVTQPPPAVPVNPFTTPAPRAVVGATATPPPPQSGATFTAVGGGMITGGPPPMAMMRTGGWEVRNRMLENPEYRDAMKRQQKLMMPRMYPDLRTALQLDEQKADQLYEVLAEQQMNQMSASRPPFTPGSQPDPNAIREWQAQQQQLHKDNEAAIASVLGADGLQQWQNYQASLPARGQVRELRMTLESAGLPLQQDQAEQLVTAFGAEQKRSIAETQAAYSANRLVTANGSVQMSAADRTAFTSQILERQKQQQQNVRDAASSILTSQQMRQLERMHASQIEMTEVSLKLSQAQQAEAAARGEIRGTTTVTPAVGFISER
jgi:hypothetical protein